MAYRTEITAILSSGTSFWRLLVPYMIAAALLAGLSAYLNNFVIPPANAKRFEFEWRYINNPYRFRGRNVHAQTGPGKFIYFQTFNNQKSIAYKFSLEKFEKNKLKFKLMADYIRWDSLQQDWVVHNYFIREINGMHEKIRTGSAMDTTLGFHPSEYNQRVTLIETMNYFELNDYIQEQKAQGKPIEYFLVEKYKRFSLPFATFILTLMGVSLSSRKVRGGIGLHLGFGIGLSFSYILFMQIADTFAASGNAPVLLAVWTPNILFGILSIFLLRIAPK